ncbi:MAG: S8 family serine peptidase [Armatimonadota bacterium]|nr:S8 family serine peptidase [Armatimonadota bacterium]
MGTAPAQPVPSGIVPGRLLVGVRPTVRTSQVQALQTATGGRVTKRLAGGQVLVVELPEGMSTQAATMRTLGDPDVLFVEPDRMVYPALTPDDPKYPEQWHLPQIRAPEAWDVTRGSADVVIGIVDTGVDIDHPDLASKIFVNRGEVPGNGIDDDGNGFVDDVNGWDFENDTNNPNPEPDGVDDDENGEVDDQVNHGTLVAGLAAAVGNNGFGVAGVDWRVRILPVQVFPDDGGTSVSQVIEGIDYAIDMGVEIINLSVGGDYAQSFTPAITRAHEAGILVVAAAGNGGRQLTDSQSTWESPVCNDGPSLGIGNYVLGVGSTDRNDLRASFSNYDGSSAGTFVDCMAPGEGLLGTGYYDPGFSKFSTYYDTNSGTSFSVALASGLAALIKSRNPGMGPDQLITAIRDSCDDIDALNPGFAGKLGAGRINCARALGVQLVPRPPRDLAAFDTPGDQGGSISLEWQLSLDDGAGADTVTEYIVLRREGTSGSFGQIKRLPAGVPEYQDTSVTDGVSYFYKVRATDGSLSSDSDVVGPVESENDLPPPTPEGVFAEDRPSDDGGAIRVGWDRYSPPGDFDHFAVYRAPVRFSTVTARQPIAVIDDADATEFVDDTTEDRVDYFYAVTAVDTFGNEEKDVTAVGPVQSFANGPKTLPAGLHLFGTPLEPADGEPATFLGIDPAELKLARWSSAAGQYQVYSGPGSLPLVLGNGYWLRLERETSFVPSGNAAPSGSLSVQLDPGWHQLANPYFGAMDMMAATVQFQGTTMDLPSADGANVMRQVFWTYNRDTNGYDMIAPFLGIGESDVEPWEGFWARVEKRCILTLPRPGGVVLLQSARPAAEGAETWTARLCAAGPGGMDRSNFFGVSPRLVGAGPLVSPPPTASGVDLYFRPDGGRVRTAGAFSGLSPAEAEWELAVESLVGGEVEVWCANPDAIPSSYALTLCDTAAGVEFDLRRGGRYRMRLRDGERARRMTLRLTRRGGALTLTSLMAEPTGAGGAAVSFTLSTAAECTVEVLNIAGRTVRVLERARPRAAGTAQVIWDGRSDRGSAVPRGTYVMKVEAAGEDGARTQAVRTLAVRR